MCRVLKVSRNAYYNWLRNGRKDKNIALKHAVLTVFDESKETYGYRRITENLKARGVKCYKNQVHKITRELDLEVKVARKFKPTTDSDHGMDVSPNLLSREFSPSSANTAWVSDITYIWTHEGWLYLAVVIDLFSRRIVGWALSNRMKKALVIDAFMNAYKTRKPAPGLIFHSDRGSQYASKKFRKILENCEVTQSMSRKGNCWDNAVAESFFKTLKRELLYGKVAFRTRKEADMRIFEYIEMFYNTKRIHSTIGYVSPMQYEFDNCA